jgi:D-arabinose 1-dehydrogenase-like Zn-dependent alcohol dehydrogenase
VKFGHALGAHVVVFTGTPGKKDDALRLGADEVVISRNADEMEKHAGSFDFILDAVAAEHDINAYIILYSPVPLVALLNRVKPDTSEDLHSNAPCRRWRQMSVSQTNQFLLSTAGIYILQAIIGTQQIKPLMEA